MPRLRVSELQNPHFRIFTDCPTTIGNLLVRLSDRATISVVVVLFSCFVNNPFTHISCDNLGILSSNRHPSSNTFLSVVHDTHGALVVLLYWFAFREEYIYTLKF